MLIPIPLHTMHTFDIMPVIKICKRKHNISLGFLKIKMLEYYSKTIFNIGKIWRPVKERKRRDLF